MSLNVKSTLKYHHDLSGQTVVIKIGGELIDEPYLSQLAGSVAEIAKYGVRPILVHGGGPQATVLAKQMGLEPKFVDGERVTDGQMLGIAQMVYRGKANSDLVAALQKHGGNAVGLCGADGRLIEGRKKSEELGYVGEITRVNKGMFAYLLSAGIIPVVAPLLYYDPTPDVPVLNANADYVAQAISAAVATRFIIATNVPGVLKNPNHPGSVISYMTPKDVTALKKQGIITGGMVPKVDAAVAAVRAGVKRAHIIDGRTKDALLNELFTPKGIGTMILPGKGAVEEYKTELAMFSESK